MSFSRHEQEAIDWETRDIAGFSMDVDSSLHDIDGFATIEEMFNNEEAFLAALLHEGESMIQQIDEQALHAANTVNRARILLEAGAITAEEADTITTSAKIWEVSMTSNRRKAESKLAKINDDIHKFFSKTTKNVESLFKKGATVAKDAARKVTKDAKKVVEEIQEKLDNNRIAEDLIKKDSILHPERKIANDKRLATLEEMDRQNINDIVHGEAAVRDAIKGEEVAQAAYDASTFKRSLNAFDKTMGVLFHSITDLWSGMKQYSDDFHQAGELLTKGFSTYFDRFAQGAEDASSYWREAQGFATKEAADESAVYKKGLRDIMAAAETNDEDKLFEAIAKYATPSSRVLIATDIEYERLVEKDLLRLTDAPLLRASWVGYSVRRVSAKATSEGLKVLERTMGAEVVGGLIAGMGVVADLAATLVEFYLGPEILLLELFGRVVMDLIRDGATVEFLDDFLQHFFLSLADVNKGAKMQEYLPEAREASGSATDPSILMMQYDSEELATTINFWGAAYIKFQRLEGHKYPAYRPLTKFHAIRRRPGRYIDIKHPERSLATAAEVNANQTLESLLSLDNNSFNNRTLVDAWFPRKAGYVRNLREFPLYQETMQWPDPHRGVPIQTSGYFSEKDLDPTIVKAFKLWAVNGTYGSVYNTSTDKRVQLAAVAANKADLAQWMNPKISWPLAWNEVKVWIAGLHGKKGIMLADMFNLAPAGWLKEWDVDLLPKKSEYGFIGSRSGKFMTDLGYEDVKTQVGRYTYRPRDRAFLQSVVNGKFLYVERYASNIKPSQPSNKIVESYPSSIASVGWAAYYRPSTPEEKRKYGKILQDGENWKTMIESKSADVIKKWHDQTLSVIWDDYVRVEKPRRTVFSYISKYRAYFIEELMYVVNSLAGKQRTATWKKYLQQMSGAHIPLQMNSLHRVTFMGMFAALAYPTEGAKDSKFIATIEKKFKGIKENDLVTTSPGWKKWIWTRGIQTVKVVTNPKGVFDFPNMFGELNARMFVLNEPRVIVIAVKGTKSASDWLIDADFSTGHFATVKADKGQNKVNIHREPNGSTKTTDELMGNQDMMTVHRGFLRAAEALKPSIVRFIDHYTKTYPDIQEVFITGHSLGAAITQLLCMMIPRLSVKGKPTPLSGNGRGVARLKNPNCYMFSSPAVGDERFAKHFGIWSGESAQVWIDGDAIVTVPPFLLPDKAQSEVAFQSVKDSMRVLSGEGSVFNGTLYAIHLMFKHTQLPPQLDFPALWKDFNTFDKKRFGALVLEIAEAANDIRPVRGGEVFMRMDGLTTYGFTEAAYDTGNSSSIYRALFNTPDIVDHFVRLHSIENTVGLLSIVAKEHPDLFSIDAENIPSWADGGTIDPSDEPDDKKVDRELAKMLQDGTAHIIGYGKSKHWHKPWSMVPRDDVVMGEGVFYSSREQEIMDGLTHNKSVKRRKIDKADHTYRGSDYM